jgi:hypothetical protein
VVLRDVALRADLLLAARSHTMVADPQNAMAAVDDGQHGTARMSRAVAVGFRAVAALGIWIAIVASATGCGASADSQRSTSRTRGEAMPMPDWIKQALIRDEFSFVMFRYDESAQADLTNGQLQAFNGTRTWQEQLYTGLLRAPDVAVQKVHPRTPSGEPDALALEYKTGGYGVQVFRIANSMAMLLTPDSETGDSLGLPGGSIETVANKLARAIIVYPGHVHLVAETQQPDGVYGRQQADSPKKDGERGPLDLLRWWYADGTFGFVTWLVTPVIDGNYPSTAFISKQQVYMWFDTYGMRRTKP